MWTTFPTSAFRAAFVYGDQIDLLSKMKIRPNRTIEAPRVFIIKKDKMRDIIDCRALNKIAKRNSTPLRRTREMVDGFGSTKYYFKLDVQSGLHQIKIRPEDVERTVFYQRYGKNVFLAMPMGLRIGPTSFPSLVSKVLQEISNEYVVIYFVHLLICSKPREEDMIFLKTFLIAY